MRIAVDVDMRYALTDIEDGIGAKKKEDGLANTDKINQSYDTILIRTIKTNGQSITNRFANDGKVKVRSIEMKHILDSCDI